MVKSKSSTPSNSRRSTDQSPNSSSRPRRNISPKNYDISTPMSWREEKELNKALLASLQEKKKSLGGGDGHWSAPISPQTSHQAHDPPARSNSSPSTSKITRRQSPRVIKPLLSTEAHVFVPPPKKVPSCSSITTDDTSQDSSSVSSSTVESRGRPKVKAQRKFAQMIAGGHTTLQTPGPNVTPIKKDTASYKSTPIKIFPKRAKTEDFLTFLCLRGTDLLPPHLEFFNYSRGEEEPSGLATPSNGRMPVHRDSSPSSSSTGLSAAHEELGNVDLTQINKKLRHFGRLTPSRRKAARACAGTPETARGVISMNTRKSGHRDSPLVRSGRKAPRTPEVSPTKSRRSKTPSPSKSQTRSPLKSSMDNNRLATKRRAIATLTSHPPRSKSRHQPVELVTATKVVAPSSCSHGDRIYTTNLHSITSNTVSSLGDNLTNLVAPPGDRLTNRTVSPSSSTFSPLSNMDVSCRGTFSTYIPDVTHCTDSSEYSVDIARECTAPACNIGVVTAVNNLSSSMTSHQIMCDESDNNDFQCSEVSNDTTADQSIESSASTHAHNLTHSMHQYPSVVASSSMSSARNMHKPQSLLNVPPACCKTNMHKTPGLLQIPPVFSESNTHETSGLLQIPPACSSSFNVFQPSVSPANNTLTHTDRKCNTTQLNSTAYRNERTAHKIDKQFPYDSMCDYKMVKESIFVSNNSNVFNPVNNGQTRSAGVRNLPNSSNCFYSHIENEKDRESGNFPSMDIKNTGNHRLVESSDGENISDIRYHETSQEKYILEIQPQEMSGQESISEIKSQETSEQEYISEDKSQETSEQEDISDMQSQVTNVPEDISKIQSKKTSEQEDISEIQTQEDIEMLECGKRIAQSYRQDLWSATYSTETDQSYLPEQKISTYLIETDRSSLPEHKSSTYSSETDQFEINSSGAEMPQHRLQPQLMSKLEIKEMELLEQVESTLKAKAHGRKQSSDNVFQVTDHGQAISLDTTFGSTSQSKDMPSDISSQATYLIIKPSKSIALCKETILGTTALCKGPCVDHALQRTALGKEATVNNTLQTDLGQEPSSENINVTANSNILYKESDAFETFQKHLKAKDKFKLLQDYSIPMTYEDSVNMKVASGCNHQEKSGKTLPRTQQKSGNAVFEQTKQGQTNFPTIHQNAINIIESFLQPSEPHAVRRHAHSTPILHYIKTHKPHNNNVHLMGSQIGMDTSQAHTKDINFNRSQMDMNTPQSLNKDLNMIRLIDKSYCTRKAPHGQETISNPNCDKEGKLDNENEQFQSFLISNISQIDNQYTVPIDTNSKQNGMEDENELVYQTSERADCKVVHETSKDADIKLAHGNSTDAEFEPELSKRSTIGTQTTYSLDSCTQTSFKSDSDVSDDNDDEQIYDILSTSRLPFLITNNGEGDYTISAIETSSQDGAYTSYQDTQRDVSSVNDASLFSAIKPKYHDIHRNVAMLNETSFLDNTAFSNFEMPNPEAFSDDKENVPLTSHEGFKEINHFRSVVEPQSEPETQNLMLTRSNKEIAQDDPMWSNNSSSCHYVNQIYNQAIELKETDSGLNSRHSMNEEIRRNNTTDTGHELTLGTETSQSMANKHCGLNMLHSLSRPLCSTFRLQSKEKIYTHIEELSTVYQETHTDCNEVSTEADELSSENFSASEISRPLHDSSSDSNRIQDVTIYPKPSIIEESIPDRFDVLSRIPCFDRDPQHVSLVQPIVNTLTEPAIDCVEISSRNNHNETYCYGLCNDKTNETDIGLSSNINLSSGVPFSNIILNVPKIQKPSNVAIPLDKPQKSPKENRKGFRSVSGVNNIKVSRKNNVTSLPWTLMPKSYQRVVAESVLHTIRPTEPPLAVHDAKYTNPASGSCYDSPSKLFPHPGVEANPKVEVAVYSEKNDCPGRAISHIIPKPAPPLSVYQAIQTSSLYMDDLESLKGQQAELFFDLENDVPDLFEQTFTINQQSSGDDHNVQSAEDDYK